MDDTKTAQLGCVSIGIVTKVTSAFRSTVWERHQYRGSDILVESAHLMM